MKKIILLSGTLGVGKSTTASELVELIEHCLHVEIDNFSNFEGFSVHNPEHLERVLREGVQHALEKLEGEHNVAVLDYVIGKDSELTMIKSLIPAHVDFKFAYLESENGELKHRICNRNRDCVEWELERTDTILEIQKDNLNFSLIDQQVDTTGKTPYEVALEVAQDFFRLNAAAFVQRSDGLILFCHRRDSKYPEKNYQVPQGGVESGETLEQAITRELEEELGLKNFTIKKGPTSGLRYVWRKGTRKRYQIGQCQHYFLVFVDSEQEKEIVETDDFDSYRWVEPKVLVEEVVDFKQPIYEGALRELGLLD
ncbi:MAG: NUDIX domain-containing protein [Deltaproteobacteria bacterium]|nr:MAG: NUDIX domain-containing protein [Deltaproteobacteria bacterium]